MQNSAFDFIIIGGSFAGLSAAMTIGRSMRSVLVIDSGKPCNAQTPHSHNFITQDGETPADISAKAKAQVSQYKSVQFFKGKAESGTKKDNLFEIVTETGEVFTAKKLILATGVRDLMLPIPGFAECWGISVLHCPYCHGYEVRDEPLGVLANGPMGFELAKLIYNWSKNLVVFTNGPHTIPAEARQKILDKGITICEKEIDRIDHEKGQIKNLVFKDGTQHDLTALFAKIPFEQNTKIPETLGCTITEMGLIQVDGLQKTTVPGVYAAGDCTTMARAVSVAVSHGTLAGAMSNKELCDEAFQ